MLALPVLFVWGAGLWADIRLRIDAYSGAPYAVYLDSGHIFYGSLSSISGSQVVMKSVRSFQQFEVGESTTNTLETQVSNPITRPEDRLVLNRQHVLFMERIGASAPVLTQTSQ